MEGGRRHGKLQPRPKNREVSPEDCGKNSGIVSVRGFRDAKFVSGVRIRVSLQRYRKHVESTAPFRGWPLSARGRLRANRRHQIRRRRDIDPITFAAAHDGPANGVQLELPSCGKIFLHGAAHRRWHAVENRLNLRGVNLRTARIRHGARLRDGRGQFLFPLSICKNLSNIHAGCRGGQRKWRKKAELAPEQSLLVRNELARESKIAQACADGCQPWLAPAGDIEANKRGALNESSRSNPLRLHRDRCRDHALLSKSCPQRCDVIHSVQQGNHAARHYLHRFQRSLQLISLGCDPENVDRIFQFRGGFRRRTNRARARRSLQRQVARIACQLFRSNHNCDVSAKRCQCRADQASDSSCSQNCVFHVSAPWKTLRYVSLARSARCPRHAFTLHLRICHTDH